MLSTAPYFDIHEQHDDGGLRLQLTGELDLASAPVLENRLEQLSAEKQSVRLDLSRLEFMDSTGIHLLISTFKHARDDRWQFDVDPDLSPQVEHLFKLTDLERVTGAQLQRSFARQAESAARMSGRLLCPLCGDVIGVYERLIVVSSGSARNSSLAREPELRSAEDVVIHHACGVDAGMEVEDWTAGSLT